MKKLLNLDRNIHNRQRKFVFSLALIVLSFVFFTMNSCNKEVELGTTEEKGLIQENPIQKVKAFKKMLESHKNGNLELRTTYTAEELIWNIEANLNYTYSYAGLTYDDYATETDTFIVPELGGSMPPSVVDRVYDEVLDSVVCFFHRVLFSDKRLKLVDVFPINGQNAIGVTTVIGNYNSILTPGNFSFEVGDDWDAMNGRCDDPNNPSNGGEEVAKATNINVGTTNYIGNPWFFTDVENVFYNNEYDYTNEMFWEQLNLNDLNPGDDIMDYNLWKAHSDGYNVLCLEYNEMNYYLENAEYEALRFEPILNKTFMHMEIEPTGIPGTGGLVQPGASTTLWLGWGEYGIKRFIEISSDHEDLYAELCE